MNRTWIAVVDASRARLFSLTRTADGSEVVRAIVEHTDLVNPLRRMQPMDRFTDARPASNHAGVRSHAIDDHRDDHLAHVDAKFARSVVDAIAELPADPAPTKLVVCASPKMLGELRDAFGHVRLAVPRVELAKDLVHLTPNALHEYLVEHALVPA